MEITRGGLTHDRDRVLMAEHSDRPAGSGGTIDGRGPATASTDLSQTVELRRGVTNEVGGCSP